MDSLEILHQRYAKALFSFAKERRSMEGVLRGLERLSSFLHKETPVSQVLFHPEISKEEKLKLLDSIGKEEKFAAAFMEFLDFLVRKNRIKLAHGIFLRYRDYYDTQHKRAKVFIRSAIELSRVQVKELIRRLCGCLEEEVVLDIRVEPSLIGGLFVKMHDKIYDSTVLGRLNNLKERLKA
ncbi:MAG TPA: ATP synthase F1 subunit delta [Candidatus Omnitrophica bacterium]|nr:ATP synthase F1 subunit delta [Candidatus Omnitrophota bacterium]